MSLRRRLMPFVSKIITSSSRLKFQRKIKQFTRQTMKSVAEVDFFYQMDDPYSHLLAQHLVKLEQRYNVEVRFHIVSQPDDAAAPERQALSAYALRDAQDIASYHELSFPKATEIPDQNTVNTALRAIIGQDRIGPGLIEIGDMFWNGESERLKNMPLVSQQEVQSQISEGTALRESLGHYLGAMLHFDGEWFWGVDRLPYLEDILVEQGLLYAGAKRIGEFQKRPDFASSPAKRRVKVEVFSSLRSPYTYLAFQEILDLPNRYPVDIVWRPVMPMVMRGLPVPPTKGRYIMADVKREADRIGIEFGHISDPVGEPVMRGYSLYPYAKNNGVGGEFLFAFCKMAWSEGRDMGQDASLQEAIERVGLNWNEALEYLDNKDWQAEIEDNRLQLFESGLWGVPSFRLVGPRGKELYSAWGRDRIWLLEHHIQEALCK